MSYNDTHSGGGSASVNGGMAGTGGGTSNGNRGRANGSSGPAGTSAWGAPIHTVTQPGPYQGISVARAPDQWSGLQDRVNAYNQAAMKWNQTTGPSVGNFFNNMAPGGLSFNAPQFSRPDTYVGGDYHIGWNPGSLAGLAPGGAGAILGPLAQKMYHVLGGQDVMLGGGKVPSNWNMGPQVADGSPGAPKPSSLGPQRPGLGGSGNAIAFGAPASVPGGAAFGPQPSKSTVTAAALAPQTHYGINAIPNHSLPYGYNSLFPNSLTASDKSLLYAKALGGGMT